MKKIIPLCLIGLFVFTADGLSQAKDPVIEISFHGAYHLFGASGSEGDYEVGVNEFPLTDSHGVPGAGVRFAFGPYEFVVVGLEFFLNFRSAVTVNDPRDGDRGDIDTGQNVQGFLTLRFNLVQQKKISFFTEFGFGGYYMLDDSSRTYTTQMGYILETEPPEKLYGIAGFGGLGMVYFVRPRINLSLSGRFVYIGSDPYRTSVSILAGIGFLL